ncbi:MAG: hypothetical protein KDE05_12370 [Parvularculaceae bacterium]|nr:hypothetical protein [Parvularculaceae bacterium]
MKTTLKLEEFRAPTKLKVSALWTSLMFLYVYGDYFNMYSPGKLEKMAAGNVGPVNAADETGMLAISMMMAVPALMIALSLLLPAALSKWLNVLFGLAYAAILAVTLPGAPLFYVGYGAIEIPLSLLIAWTAFSWPKTEEGGR